MLIDRGFQLNQGFRKTGTNNGIQVKNLQRMMIIKFEKEEERNQVKDFLVDKSKSIQGELSTKDYLDVLNILNQDTGAKVGKNSSSR